MMKLSHLRTFLAVHQHKNFTRAGEVVHLSQPAVSRHIQQLEEELGVALFEQIGKSLHVTDAGHTLVSESERVLGAMERAVEAVKAHRSATRGALRIAASSTPGLYLLPTLLRRFQQGFPEVDLSFQVVDSITVERLLVRNKIDLGFLGVELANEAIEIEPILNDQIVCFAAPSHPLAQRRRIPPRALAAETCIIRKPGSATRRLFEAWLVDVGGKLGRILEMHCSEEVKMLVAANVGFSFMSIHGLRRDIDAGRFVKLPVSKLQLHRPIYVVRHTDKRCSPVMNAFLDVVVESSTEGL